MGKTSKIHGIPVQQEIGRRMGLGSQDNAVYELLDPADKPHLRVPHGWVVKVSHNPAKSEKALRNRHEDPREAAWRGVLYKRNKYDLLKHFLGDNIPDSAFALSQARQGSKRWYAEVTLQKQVPEYTLGNLTPEQRNDPRLKANLSHLLKKMQYMYKVLGEVNARTSGHINLDAKLDLGGLSDTVRAERLDHVFGEEDITNIIETNTSPNLLVDPESMNLYCVDFDQGQWIPGMDQAKALAFEIDKRYQSATPYIGGVAIQTQS